MKYLKFSAVLFFILKFCFFYENLHGQELNNSVGIKLAGFQMMVTDNIDSNQTKIISAIHKAVKEGADFLITPEGSLSGYTNNFDQEKLENALSEITLVAKEHHLGLMLGTCYNEKFEKKDYCYNQVRIYSPDGKYIGAYSKILRCSSLDLPGTGEMLDYVEGELKTFTWKETRFGVLICNDLWATPGYTTIPNPYLAWKLKQMGAQFIIHCINSGYNQQYTSFHESSAELWAFSLRIPIVEINASYGSNPVNARSGLIDKNGERISMIQATGEHIFIITL